MQTGEEKKRARTTTINEWLCHCRRFTARTQEHYKMVINRFCKYIPLEIEQLNSRHIEAYINDLLERSSNRTANAHLTVIKSFCRWLSKIYDLPNPAAKIEMLKEDPPKQRYLTHTEYLKVLEACKDGESDTIKFLANTGLRASELVNLNGSIYDDKLVVDGKGRKRRVIPLNKTCKEILSRSTHINFSKNRVQLYRLCSRLSDKANVPRFGPHALRHYFATELLKRGVPMIDVSKLLGHSSVKTTESIYFHFESHFLNGVTDVLD